MSAKAEAKDGRFDALKWVVVAALVAAGVDPMRVDTISYGKERPIDPGHTEEAHARNRTAVTVIGG